MVVGRVLLAVRSLELTPPATNHLHSVPDFSDAVEQLPKLEGVPCLLNYFLRMLTVLTEQD